VYPFSSRHIGKTSADVLRISAAFLGKHIQEKSLKRFSQFNAVSDQDGKNRSGGKIPPQLQHKG